MERKYSVMLCCLALLMLGGICYAGTTPWPKFDYSTFGGVHYYINSPNGVGLNGEGDSSLELYVSADFGPLTTWVGINVEAYDWNGGVSSLTFKAMEARFEAAATPGCPDWTPTGLLAVVSPVPYVSNWPVLAQYPYTTAIAYPSGLNVVSVVQYTPGQDIATSGCPLVGGDGGPGSGYGYFWDAFLASCAGPMGLDWLQCPYGNAPPPDVIPDITLVSQKYGTPSTVTAFTPQSGMTMQVHLKNLSGMIWGPGNLSIWVRQGRASYSGWSGTGLDLLKALGSNIGLSNPITIVIPPISLAGAVNIKPGSLLDYSFSAFTFEGILSGGTPPITQIDVEECLLCPPGCQDDNSINVSYFVQSPQLGGDGMCKAYTRDMVPSGSFDLLAVDWSPGDFGPGGGLLYKAEIRLEGTFGRGTPDLTPIGFLGTFDLATTAPATLYRATAYDTTGNAGIFFAGPPAGNLYARCLFDVTYNLVAVGSSTAGHNHLSLGDSSFSLGTGSPGFPNGPDGETLPFNGFTAELMMRLITMPKADGGFEGNGSVASATPTFAALK
jgi:hypothetical protein